MRQMALATPPRHDATVSTPQHPAIAREGEPPAPFLLPSRGAHHAVAPCGAGQGRHERDKSTSPARAPCCACAAGAERRGLSARDRGGRERRERRTRGARRVAAARAGARGVCRRGRGRGGSGRGASSQAGCESCLASLRLRGPWLSPSCERRVSRTAPTALHSRGLARARAITTIRLTPQEIYSATDRLLSEHATAHRESVVRQGWPAFSLRSDRLARVLLAVCCWPVCCWHLACCHARRTVVMAAVIRMTPLTTGWLFWHCGAHTAKPESAPGGRFLITKIRCLLWHVDAPLVLDLELAWGRGGGGGGGAEPTTSRRLGSSARVAPAQANRWRAQNPGAVASASYPSLAARSAVKDSLPVAWQRAQRAA